jgi:drug/metabolite transporter (DMT)-like permease
MLTFVVLCLVARFGYSLNDIFIGRLARQHGRMEVAAFRGVSLGVSMAPSLLLVPGLAWGQLAANWGQLLLVVSITALANILQLHAVRYLPFGLRAALMLSTMATCSVLLGWFWLGEHLTSREVGLGAILIVSAAAAALGSHATQEIEPNIPRGAILTLLSATLMACAVFGVKRLAHATHPLLTAWAWEFGSGLVLLGPVLWRGRGGPQSAAGTRFARIAVAALPTALASGASVLALDFGELGLWGALGGTQILFTAFLGAAWHHERLGLRRWLCMIVTVAAIASLAMARG